MWLIKFIIVHLVAYHNSDFFIGPPLCQISLMAPLNDVEWRVGDRQNKKLTILKKKKLKKLKKIRPITDRRHTGMHAECLFLFS